MSERPEDLELTALESALRDLRPRPETIDPAVWMYRAGRASARGWGWPLATLGTAALAVAFGILLLIRPSPAVVERVVYVPAAQPEPSAPRTEESASSPPLELIAAEPRDWGPRSPYLQMQEQVLRWGLDGLPMPSSAPSAEEPQSVEQLLQSL